MNYVTPKADEISSLLGMVFGENPKVVESDDQKLDDKYIAPFINRDNKLVAYCAGDLPCVIFSGACLSMMPKGTAEDMVKDGNVDESVMLNYYEVMNIITKVLMDDDSEHLRIAKRILNPEEGVKATNVMRGKGKTYSFEMEVPGYGPGKLVFQVT